MGFSYVPSSESIVLVELAPGSRTRPCGTCNTKNWCHQTTMESINLMRLGTMIIMTGIMPLMIPYAYLFCYANVICWMIPGIYVVVSGWHVSVHVDSS